MFDYGFYAIYKKKIAALQYSDFISFKVFENTDEMRLKINRLTKQLNVLDMKTNKPTNQRSSIIGYSLFSIITSHLLRI